MVTIDDDGALCINHRLRIPFSEVLVRAVTSGGPGGQHANRSLTGVVVEWSVASSASLSESQRARLLEKLGEVVRSQSTRRRSQTHNRELALISLATKIAGGLVVAAPRRPTRPTRSSKERRLSEKRHHSDVKRTRRSTNDE